MVQVLDSLLPYVSEEHKLAEQTNLEELINRYKHLIPTIDMTITKTEMYTKCFIYKKEVTEVSRFEYVYMYVQQACQTCGPWTIFFWPTSTKIN